MAQQTINVGAAPNDGTGTPLRTAFQYTNSNFSELYTAVGPSGNNIVVPGNATITGDLTVDTNVLKVDTTNNRVGIGTASPALPFAVSNAGAQGFEINPNGSIVSGGIDILSYNRSTSLYKGIGFGAESYLFRVGTVSVSDAMTLNSTGLGVGVSPSQKLDIIGSLATRAATTGANQDVVSLRALNSDASAYANALYYANSQKWHYSGASLGMMLDSSGNVGIGVTPETWTVFNPVLRIKNASTGGGGALGGTGIDNFRMLTNTYYDGQYKRIGLGYATIYEQASGAHVWYSNGSGSAGSTFTPTQAMTLDASGFLRLAASNASSAGSYWFQVKNTGASSNAVWLENLSGNDRGIIVFKHDQATGATTGTMTVFQNGGGSTVGSITSSNTATAYNIASDYRLKESVQTLTNGLARINSLKPSTYKWKADGSSGEGFLAHELADVVPSAVTGEKDAVNEDGSIKAQQVDLSKVVPILVAAIQELTARVQTLETR